MTHSPGAPVPDGSAASPLRVAVVGAGMIGHVHAKVVSSLNGVATLAAVVDSDAQTASRVAAQHGAEALTSVAEVYARSDIDVVSICLPSGTHASTAVLAMRAGKHVVIEKPIDITLDAADELIRVERETGVVATVISQRRFQHAPAFVHRAVRSGELGKVTSGVAVSPFWRSREYYESGSWRGTKNLDGGGALMNQGVHVLDLLLWLLGEPIEVQGYAATLAHPDLEVEDTAVAVIRFASGAIGTILATTAAYSDLPIRLSVHGEDGSAVLNGDALQFFHVRMHESATPDKTDQTASLLPDRGVSTLDDALRDQYLDLAGAIAEGRAPSITTADGRRALATVLAIYESAETGRPVAVR